MTTTFTQRLGLPKIADYDEEYGGTYRGGMDNFDRYLSPQNCLYVSPEFTTAALGSDRAASRRYFDTIQGAIAAWESVAFQSANFGAIYIYPGRYDENLLITRSVALVAISSNPMAGVGGARSVEVRGTTTAIPVVTIQPPNNLVVEVLLSGLTLTNQATYVSGERPVSHPQILNCAAQPTPGSSNNSVTLDHCNIPAGRGNNNDWYAGMVISHAYTVCYRHCKMYWPGSADVRYVRYPFCLSRTAGHAHYLRLEYCQVDHGALSGTSTFYLESGSPSAGAAFFTAFMRTGEPLYGNTNEGVLGSILGLNALSTEMCQTTLGIQTVLFVGG